MPGHKKVAQGAPLSQSPARSQRWLNDVTDLVNRIGGGASEAPPLHGLVNPVKVRNLTDASRVRGDVVQVGDALLDPFDPRNPWFEGNVYDAAEPRPIAILVKAALEDEIAEVAINGVCVARVDVQATSDRYAAPDDGQVTLKSSSAPGAIEILSPLLSTGVQEVFVVIGGGGGSTLQLFKSTTSINAATGLLEANRGSGTVQPLNNETGANDGAPIAIKNPGFDAFAANSIGWMNMATSPPLIVSVFCTETE